MVINDQRDTKLPVKDIIILLKEIKENGSCHFLVLLSNLPCHGFLLKMA
jgi:hypothetical protein